MKKKPAALTAKLSNTENCKIEAVRMKNLPLWKLSNTKNILLLWQQNSVIQNTTLQKHNFIPINLNLKTPIFDSNQSLKAGNRAIPFPPANFNKAR